MNVTYKDAITTGLIIGVGMITYAKLADLHWPLIGGWRIPILLLMVLGILACIFSGADPTHASHGWTTTGTILGYLALGLSVFGLIFGTSWLFVLLATTLGLLWVETTIHHLLGYGDSKLGL